MGVKILVPSPRGKNKSFNKNNDFLIKRNKIIQSFAFAFSKQLTLFSFVEQDARLQSCVFLVFLSDWCSDNRSWNRLTINFDYVWWFLMNHMHILRSILSSVVLKPKHRKSEFQNILKWSSYFKCSGTNISLNSCTNYQKFCSKTFVENLYFYSFISG